MYVLLRSLYKDIIVQSSVLYQPRAMLHLWNNVGLVSLSFTVILALAVHHRQPAVSACRVRRPSKSFHARAGRVVNVTLVSPPARPPLAASSIRPSLFPSIHPFIHRRSHTSLYLLSPDDRIFSEGEDASNDRLIRLVVGAVRPCRTRPSIVVDCTTSVANLQPDLQQFARQLAQPRLYLWIIIKFIYIVADVTAHIQYLAADSTSRRSDSYKQLQTVPYV